MKILVGEKDVFELQDLVSIELIWMEPVLLETGSKQGCYVDFAFDFTKASSRQFLEVENSGYGPDTAQSGMSSAMVIPATWIRMLQEKQPDHNTQCVDLGIYVGGTLFPRNVALAWQRRTPDPTVVHHLFNCVSKTPDPRVVHCFIKMQFRGIAPISAR